MSAAFDHIVHGSYLVSRCTTSAVSVLTSHLLIGNRLYSAAFVLSTELQPLTKVILHHAGDNLS